MDNVEILKMLFTLLVITTILLSFMMSLIIFRISLESESKTEKEIKKGSWRVSPGARKEHGGFLRRVQSERK